MEFKIGDLVTYKEKYSGTYTVISEDSSEYWLQSTEFENVHLKYPPEMMKKILCQKI